MLYTHNPKSFWNGLVLVAFFLVPTVTGGCVLDDAGHEISTRENRIPESFLLTWQRDPSSTMTIDWHPTSGTDAILEYRLLGEQEWIRIEGDDVQIPGIDRTFRRSELTGLQPDQRYEFRFNEEPPVYQFRTMPDQLTRPIRFVAGGDLLHRVHWMRNTAASVMSTDWADDLDFAVIGGDLAYTDGDPLRVGRWFDYFQIWAEEMVTSDNRAIPHIAAIGNHEVRRGYIHAYSPEEYMQPDFVQREAPYFSTFIPFPGADSFGVLDFGDYLSLFLLDSGHSAFIDGEQTEWLHRALHQRGHVRHLVPVYHVPAWPSVRDFDGYVISQVRGLWVPLFEEYGVRLAFEKHDHTYKRTHPIRNGQIDDSGIHYIGDGAWGVSTRQIRTDDEGNRPWYLAEADSLRHFIMGELDGDQIRLEMFDEDGRPIDAVTFTGGHAAPR